MLQSSTDDVRLCSADKGGDVPLLRCSDTVARKRPIYGLDDLQ